MNANTEALKCNTEEKKQATKLARYLPETHWFS